MDRLPDAVEAILCEDGITVQVEAFAGDESLGTWSFELESKLAASDFDHRQVADEALASMSAPDPNAMQSILLRGGMQ